MDDKWRVVKQQVDLPSWFSLKKYDPLNSFSTLDWYEQIMVRRGIMKMLDEADQFECFGDYEDRHWATICDLAEFIETGPLVNATNGDKLHAYLGDARLFELKNNRPKFSFGVRPLTLREFYLQDRHVLGEKRLYLRKWQAQFDDPDWSDLGNDMELTMPQEWFEEPVDSHMHSPLFGNTIRVNLSLPENLLVEQFTALIRSLKKEQQAVPAKPRFENWIKFGLLPYIDLTIWARKSGVRITNRVMADAIFQRGDGGEEVVRKTTEKLVESVLSKLMLDTLAAIAASEKAEQNQS